LKIRKFHFEKSANFLTLFCIVPLRSTLQYLDCGAPTPPLMGMGGDRCTSLMKDKKPRKMNFPALFLFKTRRIWWEFGDAANNSYHRAYSTYSRSLKLAFLFMGVFSWAHDSWPYIYSSLSSATIYTQWEFIQNMSQYMCKSDKLIRKKSREKKGREVQTHALFPDPTSSMFKGKSANFSSKNPQISFWKIRKNFFLEKSANVNKKGKSVKKFGVLYLNELNGLERVNIYLRVFFFTTIWSSYTGGGQI